MRGIRIGAVIVAVVLACVVISHIFSVEPAPPSDDRVNIADQDGPPPNVPPPPPVPGAAAAHPAKKRHARSRAAASRVAAARTATPLPDVDTLSSVRPIIRDAETGQIIEPQPAAPDAPAAVPPPPPPAQTAAAADSAKGPVIVVPHERPKEEGHGARWLKAVGRALGIGAKPNPEEDAFK